MHLDWNVFPRQFFETRSESIADLFRQTNSVNASYLLGSPRLLLVSRLLLQEIDSLVKHIASTATGLSGPAPGGGSRSNLIGRMALLVGRVHVTDQISNSSSVT